MPCKAPLIAEVQSVISLLQFVLKVFNLSLKVELFSVVLSLERKDLVVGFLGNSLALVCGSVQLLMEAQGRTEAQLVSVAWHST